MEKWLGLPSSMSLRIPSGKAGLTVLAHSPGSYSLGRDGSGGGGAGLLHSDENGDIFEQPADDTPFSDHAMQSVPEEGTLDSAVVSPSSPLFAEDALAAATDAADNATAPVTPAGPDSVVTSPQPLTVTIAAPPLPTCAPAPEATAAPVDPNYIPEFQPLAVLGRGAYSKIIQVRARDTGTLYAMKVLRKIDVVSVGHESHVLTEQAILARLAHPFVCRLFYAFQSQSKLYMVMTYAAGGDLWTLIRRQQLSEALCAFYTAELVLALRYAHAANVYHRDIKPENSQSLKNAGTQRAGAYLCVSVP